MEGLIVQIQIYENHFVYSDKNRYNSNIHSDEIIKVLNINFDLYKNVNQKGITISKNGETASNWIISNMKGKNVKYVISVDNENNKILFPLEKFNEVFNIKTVLRRKKSGSQNIPKKYYSDFENLLSQKFSKYDYFFYQEEKKAFLNINKRLIKSECYIESLTLPKGKKYFLSNKGNELYEVKLTSSVKNPNIIFELSIKDNIDLDIFSAKYLIDYIKNQ